TISVLRNTSTSGTITASSFAPKVDFTSGTSPYYIAIGDIDGDGKPDVVVANSNSNTISLLRNTSTSGTISLAAKVDFTTGSEPRSVAMGDLNGDGVPEIATANFSSATVSVFQIDAAVLPITITNTKAYQKNAGVQIEWTMQQEDNIDRYEVERSQNGQQFSKLGSVIAKGNSSLVTTYNLFDANPLNGVNFYRIKTIDKSGQVTYSRMMKVNISSGITQVTVYPNPTNGNTIALQISNLKKGSYTLTLTNKTGQQIINKVIEHTGGSATETLEFLKACAAGVYRLKLSGEGATITRQVIKN
ncbi:MAG: T9SS type A sorting domain-containing protein, partial [Chitinophagaceae bacterium]|nr:T9SS type A sorting domain-containing protein [Chitinophagaceae bacterium]